MGKCGQRFDGLAGPIDGCEPAAAFFREDPSLGALPAPDELKTALDNLQNPAAPNQPPLGQAQVRSRHFPVWFVSPAVIRIGWVSGHGHAVLPRMATALARLDGSVRVAEPTRRERPSWRKLTAEQVDELARELVHVHGAVFEATALLVRAGGVSHGEASAQVQQLQGEGTVPGPIPPR